MGSAEGSASVTINEEAGADGVNPCAERGFFRTVGMKDSAGQRQKFPGSNPSLLPDHHLTVAKSIHFPVIEAEKFSCGFAVPGLPAVSDLSPPCLLSKSARFHFPPQLPVCHSGDAFFPLFIGIYEEGERIVCKKAKIFLLFIFLAILFF